MKRSLIILILFISIFLVACGRENTNTKKNRMAILETNKGIIKLELFEDKMPLTTGNFVKLAEQGFFDNTRFHRVIDGFMIQGGDPLTKDYLKKDHWGTGGPGYNIKDEFIDGLSNLKGTIAMANSGRPNSGGSQFFINLVDNTYLDFDKPPASAKHPVFGKVINGMDVAEKIGKVPTDARDRPLEDIVIEKIVIEKIKIK